MLSEIRLSVIIPAYNPGKKIIPCITELQKNLEYLSAQTKLIYEILIINDGGDDIDLSFVRNNEKIKLLKLRKNKGVGYARQFGLKISKYDYLLYLDSDVVMENQKTIMVIDGTTGQSSIKQVEEFSKYIKIDGIIISKLDGSAIGGTIVSIIDRLKIPVFGIGMGENKNSLEEFDAEKFLSKILND